MAWQAAAVLNDGRTAKGRDVDQAINLYPWDVVDDPGAAERIAGLGVGAATLASSYHTVRALAPNNPQRAVVDAAHAAVYFPPDEGRYDGLRLRPVRPTWVTSGAYVTAQRRLRGAGLAVHAWTVLLHSSLLGRRHPDLTVENAFGDRYPYALCPAHPEVRAYAGALLSDLTHNHAPDAVELESWGYLGVVHGSHHDKAGIELDPFHELLLSTCFNPASQRAIADAGGDPERIRAAIQRQLRRYLAGDLTPRRDRSTVAPLLDELLGASDAQALVGAREQVTSSLLDELLAALPTDQPPRVYLHATPSPYDTGSAVGVDPRGLPSGLAGTILPLLGRDPDSTVELVRGLSAGGRARAPIVTLPLFGANAGRFEQVLELAEAARSAGAAGARYYHWGLVPAERHGWIERIARMWASDEEREGGRA